MGFAANYLANLAALAAGLEPSRPLLASYCVTHRCPLNCRYCSDGAGKPFKEDRVDELNTADALRLLRILRVATDTLDITGGEPLLRQDLEEILSAAKKLRFRTVLNTKGLGLAQRPAVLRHCDVLVLSVDALDAARLAELLGADGGSAQQVLETLRELLARRGEYGFRLVLAAVAAPENLAEVAAVLRQALAHGLGFQLSPQLVGTRIHPALRGNAGYAELVEAVRRAKRQQRGVLGVEPYLRNLLALAPFRCHPLLMPTIRPDGRLYYPCLESGRADVSLLDAGSYRAALAEARRLRGAVPRCGEGCHIFCHMALSMLQRHPLAALGEWRHWRG